MSEPKRGPSYLQGDPASSVAICTLSSHDLLEKLASSPTGQRAAIIGPLETENLGIERMLTTLLERPRIRWLVVCGDESRGRYQGQALRCLFEQGLAPDGTILGARSRRAWVRSVAPEHVEVARHQVRLRDLTGTHDLGAIADAFSACAAQDPGPFQEAVSLPKPEPILVPQRAFRLTEHDPCGFLVILVDGPNDRLLVEHYAPEGHLLHCVAGPDAESLCAALVEWGLLSRLDHAAYLGRELAKAEIALRRALPYHQDEPLSR